MKDMYRFIVEIDIEAKTLTEAYGKLHDKMTQSRLDWATTDNDEVYNPAGDLIDPQRVREIFLNYHMAKLAKNNEGE